MPRSLIQEHKEEIRDYANDRAKSMINWFTNRYKITDRDVKVIVTFDPRQETSYGGLNRFYEPEIELAGVLCLKYHGPRKFDEYDHYKDDKIIGSVMTNTWKQFMDLLIAHELSHVFEILYRVGCFNPEKVGIPDDSNVSYASFNRGHGKLFQEIYKIFRIKFCNDLTNNNNVIL